MKTTTKDVEKPQPRRWKAKLDHPSWALCVDQCPRCEYPEAEGGWCANCGWSLPDPRIKWAAERARET